MSFLRRMFSGVTETGNAIPTRNCAPGIIEHPSRKWVKHWNNYRHGSHRSAWFIMIGNVTKSCWNIATRWVGNTTLLSRCLRFLRSGWR